MNVYTLINLNASFILIAFFYELFFQYPSFLPHPVRWMGRAISSMERLLLNERSRNFTKTVAGGITAAFLVGSTFVAFLLLEKMITNPWLLFGLRAFFAVSCVAAGSLFFECLKVMKLCEAGRLELARKQMGMLVTRDTSRMDEKTLLTTTLETMSENLSDGVIAPLFYLFLGGIPLAMAYKMASTLDSMVGYKNEKYRYFGWFSAKLDDALNFIPARLTALFIFVSAFILGLDTKGSIKSWRRDRGKTDSPNSGNPEAAMAGALGIQFGGKAVYFSQTYDKPLIGPGKRAVERDDIQKGIKLGFISSLLFIFAGLVIEYLVRRAI